MSDFEVPAGFTRYGREDGFLAGFGPLFLDRAGCRLGFRVAPHHANFTGVCHGGALATFADAQIVPFLPDPLAPHHYSPTISLTVDYFAPVPVGAWVEASVLLAKLTRTMMFTQANLSVDGELVARSSAIYRNGRSHG